MDGPTPGGVMMRYALVALAVLVSATHLSAQSKPTIVLVHGAWADASGWHDVTVALQARGYKVLAAQEPLFFYPQDNASTNTALPPRPGPRARVGHSYPPARIPPAAS